jgi:hypothetical protein
MTKAQIAERDEYRAKLREMLKPGDTLHTVLRSRARSGMYRTVDVYRLENGKDGKEPDLFRLTYWIAKAAGLKYDDKHEAIGISGCGMDVGFEVVYSLGRSLWPNGVPCAGERCHSNDHANGDRDRETPHTHGDGGYALAQRWIG